MICKKIKISKREKEGLKRPKESEKEEKNKQKVGQVGKERQNCIIKGSKERKERKKTNKK